MKAFFVLGCAILVMYFIGVDADTAPDILGRRQLRGPFKAGCRCIGNACECCAEKKFEATRLSQRVSFDLKGCVDIYYFSQNTSFVVSLKVNGMTLFEHRQSLREYFSVCRGVPRLTYIQAYVCLMLYDIDISQKRFCVKLSGLVDLKIKTFEINIPIACPIPHPFAEDYMTANTFLASDPSRSVHQGQPDMDESHKELDRPALMKELQRLLEDKSIREYVYDEMKALQDGSADENPKI